MEDSNIVCVGPIGSSVGLTVSSDKKKGLIQCYYCPAGGGIPSPTEMTAEPSSSGQGFFYQFIRLSAENGWCPNRVIEGLSAVRVRTDPAVFAVQVDVQVPGRCHHLLDMSIPWMFTCEEWCVCLLKSPERNPTYVFKWTELVLRTAQEYMAGMVLVRADCAGMLRRTKWKVCLMKREHTLFL